MIDTADISVKAGDGGHGAALFRREKFIPKGGPWGGDGGNGGNVVFKVDPHLNTLSDFRRKKHFKAEDGGHGMKNRMKGKDGETLIIKVPQGTIIKDKENNILADLTQLQQEATIARGGRGGLGNWHFKSSVNQTPLTATPGTAGEEKLLYLELKLIADIGLVGMPSAGKSTLLNSLTNTSVKTAEYHFTTLHPNLGVLTYKNYPKDLVIADIPGLIEGASEGKGLGHDFLRHIERTKVLVHIIDGLDAVMLSPGSLVKNYLSIRTELSKWNNQLAEKPEIIVINKFDITEVNNLKDAIYKEFKSHKLNIYFISAVTLEGIEEVIQKMVNEIQTSNKKIEKLKPKMKESIEYTIENLKNRRIVFRTHKSIK